ncbi:MAG: hypothetical protein A2W17_11965 [Planctomycetes bacterium RBG_16_41_13]|nr:MAG: hypothetical protein A2W17_11965 [Planctomycetes bacterium RBG_16_41_13]
MKGHKQLLTEISNTRDVFTELDDFFCNADESISRDPEDPREGIGRLPGLDRLMFLIPCVINRLEEDISESNECENVAAIIEGLYTIQEGIQSVLTYYFRDDVEGAINLLSNVLSKIDKPSGKKFSSGIRIFCDIARIAPDFQIILGMFEGFRENRRIRPKEPETNTSWSPECWLDYYREQARLEEPLIAMVDAEGLSEASLEKGMKRMVEESEQRDKMMEKQLTIYKLMKNRDAAFSPEHPERFLDLSEIPDIKDENDDGDYEVRVIDLCYEDVEEEPQEPWASSLPELCNWNKIIQESSFGDTELYRQDFEDEPVYRLLKPFVHRLFECLKQDDLRRVKESKSGVPEMRSPLDHYLVILALKAQVRISSCGVQAEDVGHEAPRKGVYLFAMECLERITEAIERFQRKHLYHLAAEARNIKKQIEKILAENL